MWAHKTIIEKCIKLKDFLIEIKLNLILLGHLNRNLLEFEWFDYSSLSF